MATKKYESGISGLVLAGIRFESKAYPSIGSTYKTSDPNKQKRIESSATFKKGVVRLVSVVETAAKAPQTEEETLPDNVYKVESLQEAREIIRRLCAEKGIAKLICNNRHQINAAATKLGIVFKGL